MRIGMALVASLALGCGSSSSTAQKTIFVTRQLFDGNLGGLAGADAKCQTAADASALGGQWHAWLSTSTTEAIDRVTSSEAYYRVDGLKVFNNKVNWSTLPLAPIQVGEDGSIVFPTGSGGCTGPGEACAWTGTDVGGHARADICSDWSGTGLGGTAGGVVNTDAGWTNTIVLSCNAQAHIYCFEE